MKTKVHFFLLPLLAGAALSACTVGPDFKPPTPPQLTGYISTHDTALSAGPAIISGATVPRAWWQEFKSPALDEVMTEAFAHSPDLAAAQATLASARETINADSGELLPQAALNGTAGRQKYGVALFGPSDFTVPPFTYYELGPSISYALDYTGGLRRGVERDQALAAVQGYQLNAAYLYLSGNIAIQALSMAGARAKLAVSRQIIADDQKNVDLVQKAFNAGGGTRTDILTAQSQLANDRALLPGSNQDLDVARHALAVLSGHAPAEWQPPEFALADFTLPQSLPLILPSELVHQRPDILAAESQLHAASAAIGIATSHLYPQITLTASTTQESLNPAALFKGASNAFGLAGNLVAPLFNGGTLRAQRRAAIDSYNAAKANYRKVALHAFSQVADALQAIRNDGQQVEVQKEALKTADQSMKLTRASFQAGNIGILQVVDAERQHSQAQLGLTGAQIQVLNDVIQLHLALGGSTQ